MAQKDIRQDLRATPEQRELIEKAASIRRTILTNFMLTASCEAAEDLLAQQRHFELSNEQWEAFCTALEAPPKEIPALKKLFVKPSVFINEKA